MKYVIDRIEKNILVLEDENKNIINFKSLDNISKLKEGEIIEILDNGKINVLKQETFNRRKAIEEKIRNLWEE